MSMIFELPGSCKAEHLIGDTRDHRDQDDPADDPKPDRIYTDHHEEQDADHHNDQKKARSAALYALWSFFLHFSTLSTRPCSKQLMHLCSDPWYMNVRLMSSIREITLM
mgnify:CR=1 FL=1